MKKAFLIAVTCFTILKSHLFAGQFEQSISYTGPTDWVPNTSVTISVFGSFNYNAFGLSYWLEVPDAIAPFVRISRVDYFFPPGPPVIDPPGGFFNSSTGARPGYKSELLDLGGGISDPTVDPPFPPGSYHFNDITFTISPGAPLGTYTMFTTTINPHASIVSDTKFNDHAIPASPFVFNVVPEPGTVSLLGLGIAGGSLLINRRRKDPSRTAVLP